jgi:hypothetical protein
MTAIDKRIEVRKLDRDGIERISSEIVRALTEIATDGPNTTARLHLRFGPHLKAPPFTKWGGGGIIIGDAAGD